VGAELTKDEEAGSLESVKAVSEIMMPVAGTVTEINEMVVDDPEKVNDDPMGAGWLFKVRVDDTAELNGLMDESAYAAMIRDQSQPRPYRAAAHLTAHSLSLPTFLFFRYLSEDVAVIDDQAHAI
jgi:hypothetical protein